MHNGATAELVDGDHVVRFYDDDQDLVDVVAGYLVAAVIDGDAVVVVATPEHREAFLSGLRRAQLDVDDAIRSGDLQVLDAAETLESFMVDGMPDPLLFRRSVASLIEGPTANDRPVRAYGEMVALLWAEGNRQGAIELEGLWNELSDELPFALFCAYPASSTRDPHAANDFSQVCHLHSEVVGGAPMPFDAQASRRFAGTNQDPQHARAFTADTLRAWALGELIDDCLVVVSELASNAVRHAGTEFTVSLSRVGDVLQIVVGDRSAVVPKPREAKRSDSDGRGLQLVDALAEDWGNVIVENGKLVWAQLGITA